MANPFCDVNRNSLQLSSNRLVLDFVGLPGLNDDLDFNFPLQGELTANRETISSLEIKQVHSFKGWVTMQLNVDLPFPFSLMPESIVLSVGNNILDRILGAMEGELVSTILGDYNVWCCTVSSHITGGVQQTLAP
ncbi:uncharacterized protein LOC131072113 [Cryptomeria japonica]|uniref:uncharacterized protein LOC131072113 n=1 Tax=Cryptomeria japonica TaxID=3369 RepID=UPI0027DA507E|nr:uncharacterized protein LOC131072113 [Cryptomeria japonica]